MTNSAVKVFLSHSDTDEDADLRAQLAAHLANLERQGIITCWHKDKIIGGEDWSTEINNHLNQANIIVLLVSADFLASDSCMNFEVPKALELHESGEAIIIPVILRSVDWSNTAFSHLRALPKDALPVVKWSPIDDAFKDIALTIKYRAEEIYAAMARDLGKVELENNLEFPEGPVPLDSRYYVERSQIDQIRVESQCYGNLLKPASLIRIKAPRKFGKTSLITRLLNIAKEKSYRTAYVDLGNVETTNLTSIDRFLRSFCAELSQSLGLENQIGQLWDSGLPQSLNCTEYFEEEIFGRGSPPLVIAIDNVDRIFPYNNLGDFFSWLRSRHDAGRVEPNSVWHNMRFVIAHSTDVYLKLDCNRSPFNVGVPISLPEFPETQIAELAHRHGLSWTKGEIAALRKRIGGHPHLVRVACYNIACKNATLNEVLKNSATLDGVFSDHLGACFDDLKLNPDLVDLLGQIIDAPRNFDIRKKLSYRLQIFKLKSMGIIKIEDNFALLTGDLYEDFFENYWR